MFKRACKPSTSQSFFLFGPRATGKSTLIQSLFKNEKNVMYFDLLDPDLEQELSVHPGRLIEKIEGRSTAPQWIVLDEVQKIPKLLDVVHKLIFEKKLKFALTGSSARKLKRGHSNLLAGRAFSFNLHPLTFIELENSFNLEQALQWGTLPSLFQFNNDNDRKRYLRSYVQNYIKEEILVEQLIRNIEPFRAFLEVAAQSNAEIINYSKLSREAGIEPKNVERYFSILEDTLLGFFLLPYSRSIRKRQLQSPKFYFFDLGVVQALRGQLDTSLSPRSYGFGKQFEHLVILELIRLNDYFEMNYKFSYLRTANGVEIDLVLERARKTILVEIKSTNHVTQDDLKSLKGLGSEMKCERIVLCQERTVRKTDGILICPWQEGIRRIFNL